METKTYRIIKTPDYYSGTCNAPREGYVREEDDSIITFDTLEAAQEWIDDEEMGTYYLAHGEAGRPDFAIEDEDAIPSGELGGEKLSFDDWKEIKAEDVPATAMSWLAEMNVEPFVWEADQTVFVADVKIETRPEDEDHYAEFATYRIAFCQKNTAI